MTTLSLPTARTRPLSHWRPTTQGVMTALLLLFCGGLVGYPIVYLVLESLNTGDADTFPPESLGLDNYVNLIDDSRILTNTAFVACIATVMAVVLGFLIFLAADRLHCIKAGHQTNFGRAWLSGPWFGARPRGPQAPPCLRPS